MRPRRWFQPPRQLLAVFLAMTLVSALALSWLGWRMIQQDRALEAQRDQERLELAADRVTAALQRNLAGLEEISQPSEDTQSLIFTPQNVEATPPLLYYPFVPSAPEADPAAFASGESLEFRGSDLVRAAETYRKLATADDPLTRAGALMRLGRVLRKAQEAEAALDAYANLARLSGVAVAGTPADLVARSARCEVLEELPGGGSWKSAGQRPARGPAAAQGGRPTREGRLQAEAQALLEDLRASRWKLTRGQYEFYEAEAARILGVPAAEPERAAPARAAIWLYDE